MFVYTSRSKLVSASQLSLQTPFSYVVQRFSTLNLMSLLKTLSDWYYWPNHHFNSYVLGLSKRRSHSIRAMDVICSNAYLFELFLLPLNRDKRKTIFLTYGFLHFLIFINYTWKLKINFHRRLHPLCNVIVPSNIMRKTKYLA